MVNRTHALAGPSLAVLTLVTALLLSTTPHVLAKAPPPAQTVYKADRTTLALGEPLTLTVSRHLDAKGPALASLELEPLSRDFEIQGRTLGHDGQQENLSITLYPRRTGRIRLPALGLAASPPVITVTEFSSTMPRVQFRVSMDPAEPLVRQPSTLTMEACDDGTLLWKRPELATSEGLNLRPINETEIITQRDGLRCTAHRWHWAVLPAAAGRSTLALPILEASKFGTRLRFQSPAFELLTRPLPVWLPTEAAIGQPDITAEPLPSQAVINRPLAWRLHITGGYSTSALQAILDMQRRQALSPLDLSAYAPRVEWVGGMTASAQHIVTLYLLPRQTGHLRAPDLLFPWFNPATGQLEHTRLQGPSMAVEDPVRQQWLLAAGAGAALLLLALAVRQIWRHTAWRRQRRSTIRKLSHCHTLEALCGALLTLGQPGLEKHTRTLREWQQVIEAKFMSRGLDALVEALERSRFSRQAADALNPTGMATEQETFSRLTLMATEWLRSIQPRPSRHSALAAHQPGNQIG